MNAEQHHGRQTGDGTRIRTMDETKEFEARKQDTAEDCERQECITGMGHETGYS